MTYGSLNYELVSQAKCFLSVIMWLKKYASIWTEISSAMLGTHEDFCTNYWPTRPWPNRLSLFSLVVSVRPYVRTYVTKTKYTDNGLNSLDLLYFNQQMFSLCVSRKMRTRTYSVRNEKSSLIWCDSSQWTTGLLFFSKTLSTSDNDEWEKEKKYYCTRPSIHSTHEAACKHYTSWKLC